MGSIRNLRCIGNNLVPDVQAVFFVFDALFGFGRCPAVQLASAGHADLFEELVSRLAGRRVEVRELVCQIACEVEALLAFR